MKIKKTVSDNGKIVITVDGHETDYHLSRKLTGTTDEKGHGIFENMECEFHFGDFQTTINFGLYLFPIVSVACYGKKLSQRITRVREWVADCRATAGTIEILDLPEIAEKLAEENKLLYRNKKGQIKPLD